MSNNREILTDLPSSPYFTLRKKEFQESRRYLEFRLRKDWILNLLLPLTWANSQTVLEGFFSLSNEY